MQPFQNATRTTTRLPAACARAGAPARVTSQNTLLVYRSCFVFVILQDGRFESLDLVDLPSTGASKNGNRRSSTMFDPVFGPIGRSPLEKEAVLGIDVRSVFRSVFRATRPFRFPAKSVECCVCCTVVLTKKSGQIFRVALVGCMVT